VLRPGLNGDTAGESRSDADDHIIRGPRRQLHWEWPSPTSGVRPHVNHRPGHELFGHDAMLPVFRLTGPGRADRLIFALLRAQVPAPTASADQPVRGEFSRWAARSKRGKIGRAATIRNIKVLVLRLARENPGWEIPQSWPAWIAEHWIGGCRRELWTQPSSGTRPCAGSRASTKPTITSTGRTVP
jgi:hypothetical protein